ncbi:NUDIX hydrolase [Corynebacterium casei]|uniref:NUDIX hydrolase n=1 Tax=Corynebacterium casei TaxID=160386 RepID=UPI003F98A4AD
MHETDKDIQCDTFISGRLQQVPVDPNAEFERTTLAAGAILWRGNPAAPEVALIHRPHYDDWSLPKGKVDPGESLPATVARELWEETGYHVKLGKLVGKVTYPVQGRTKVVYYWLAQVLSGEFTANEEADELVWMPIAEARERVTYKLDEDVLDKALKRLELMPETMVLYIRHARAHDRKTWSGDDNLRPLDKKGRRQAEMLIAELSSYQPTAIYSAAPDRCLQTAAPLADELNLPVHVDALLGDDAWLDQPTKARLAFDAIVARGGTPVVVSQGRTIPSVIEQLAPKFMDTDDLKVKKASVWVLSFHDGELTGADYLASPLPVR